MVTIAALVAAVGMASAVLGGVYVAAEQAATAAEAAALAAAVATYPGASDVAPVEAAASAAAANSATVESCRCPVDASLATRQVVVIAVRDVDVPLFGRIQVRRAAAAEFDPAAWLGVAPTP
jgi:hypothetical protein